MTSPPSSGSFAFDHVDRFVAGTVGPPGRREFFLQAVRGSEVVSIKAEKQQVAILADYLDRVLTVEALPETPPAPHHDLVEPAMPVWVAGSMTVAVDEVRGHVTVIIEQAVFEDDLDDDDPLPAADARFGLTSGQIRTFIEDARTVIRSGRPPCVLCGRPIDPDGHSCPRLN